MEHEDLLAENTKRMGMHFCFLIDDNIEFTSPEEFLAEEGLEINLKPGKYYWKAVGVLKSEVRELTIQSEVDLRLRKLEGDNYGVFNAGNVNLNVDVYGEDGLVGQMKLEVDEEGESEGTKFVGGQDE